MSTLGLGNNSSKPSSAKAINPFASSLLENEQKNTGLATDQNNNDYDAFANALLQTGDHDDPDHNQDPRALRKQQEEALLAQKKEVLRKKLHDRINPVDVHDLFSAKENKAKEELNQVRQELELLIADIKELNQEVAMAVSQDVVNPGSEGGVYYQNFFHQLRALIMLLRQKVSSARSWAQQMQGKNRKKKGLNYKSTKGVQDSMHNERNSGANAAG